MKYKIVGIANYIVGGIQILVAVAILFLVIPRIQSLYQDFGSEVSPTNNYILPIINVVLGSFNIFFGYKIFSSKDKLLDKYFTISIIYLVITFITTGILTQLSALSVIIPIYELSSSLN